MPIILLSINIGSAQEIDIDGRPVLTGIIKQPVTGAVEVLPLGLAGDEQADLSVHGGMSKAIYAYPSEHLPFWRTVRAQAKVAGWDDPVPPGMLGENLTISGMVESQAWIGDRLRFAECELAVSEPRFPCFKLNAALGFKHAAKMMTANGWCGFYLSVIRPGRLQAGETAELIPGAREVGIAELFRSRVAAQRR